MAKLNVLIVLGLLSTVFAYPESDSHSVTKEQLEAFRDYLKELTKEDNVSCSNYESVCLKIGDSNPNDYCHIALKGWLCDNLQTLEGVREIVKRMEKVHSGATKDPDAVAEADEGDDDDENDDYDSNSY